MKILVLDELRSEEIIKIGAYLKEMTNPGPIEGVFWLPVPEHILTKKQKVLEYSVGPYKMFIELKKNSVHFELLVRSEKISNEGGGGANINQAIYVFSIVDEMVKKLNLTTCL
ncbi:MAG: hypothetical protein LBF22_13845 [Deltaproteobacteria bacterium]|jgi:hypothetical protein|nr:hypothetical protein [Deltaproteobacteria bacterium]